MKKNFMLVVAALVPVLFYLLGTFISWEPNVHEWGSLGRYVYVASASTVSLVCVGFWSIDNRK